MPRNDKRIEQLIRIWDNGKNPIVHAKDLAFLTNGEIEGYEKRNILLFRGHSDEIQCNKCHKGSCTIPLKRVEYPDGQKKGVGICPDQEQGGRLEFELDELRYWEVIEDKLVELGYRTEAAEDEFISLTEAGKLLGKNKGTINRWADSGKIKDNGETGQKRKVSKGSVFILKHEMEEEITQADYEDYKRDIESIPDMH